MGWQSCSQTEPQLSTKEVKTDLSEDKGLMDTSEPSMRQARLSFPDLHEKASQARWK